MASKLKVDQIEGQSGTSIEVPSGHTLKVTDHGNNKIITTNSSGVLTPLTIGSAGQTLKVNSSANGFEFGAVGGGGKVLQVLTNVSTATSSTSSTSYQFTSSPSINITPSASTSKVLILATMSLYNNRANYFSSGTIYRGSTNLATSSSGDMIHVRTQDADEVYGCVAISFLDSPNTTSATTYKLGYRAESSSDSARINVNNTQSQIVVMEIGA